MTRATRAAIACVAWISLSPAVQADIPSPTRNACRGLTEGARCEYREGYDGQGVTTAGQCVTVTCRTPGANGTEYSCLECQPLASQAQSSRSFAQPVARGDGSEPASASNGNTSGRLWISMLLGVAALGGGIMLVARSSRTRRS